MTQEVAAGCSPVPPLADPAEIAFSAVNAAFGSLGRVCMALDAQFRIRYASRLLEGLVGADGLARLRGAPIEELLGPELFGPDGPLRRALMAGEKREGWRAMIPGAGDGPRLMSLSATPLQRDPLGVCDPAAVYLVVLRPDDEAANDLATSVAGSGLISRAPAMARIFRLIDTLQHSESTVLITGESGTGKEVMARVVHAHSPRRSGPFVAFNAAALPGDLLESELFGHVRGAFTGAVRDRVGRFEAATDGTLFLDEVGDVPLHLQVKLLRVLQEHTYERVGDSQQRTANARIIAATNRDLRKAVADGTFREDLYYRLRVIPMELPPLRARREDIEPVARLLLSRVGARTGRALRLSPATVRALLSYPWPGNVRELENALEFAATITAGQTVQPEDLPREILEGAAEARPAEAAAPPAAAPGAGAAVHVLEPRPVAPLTPHAAGQDAERARIERALEAHRWSRAATAQALGLSRSTLWRRMRALGLG